MFWHAPTRSCLSGACSVRPVSCIVQRLRMRHAELPPPLCACAPNLLRCVCLQLLQLSAFLDKTLNDRLSMIEKHRQECLFKKEHSRAAADQNNSTTTSDANNVHASPWTPAASSCWAADDTYAVVTHNETSPLNSSADLVNSSSMFDNVANGFSSFTASVGQGVSSFVGMLWS